ncbi:MAG: AAA family ATPase [Gemmatimonadota bacterium]
MKPSRLLRDLARPDAYPHDASDLEIIQTHISVIALAGRYAYKVRKPVDLDFLDFTTLEKRLHDCREEVRLNRRLAPDVYLGVVPLVESERGLLVDAEGSPAEYAVKMERLPSEATLLERLLDNALEADVLRSLGRRIAAFHDRSESGPGIARYGQWETVAGNARENLEQSAGHVPECVSDAVFRRLHDILELRLRELRSLIEDRARAGVPRDTHGDLHLDHVYLFPERRSPNDLVVIDCIEFNERFRYADPVADMAFLVMDLKAHGRRDLAQVFEEAYFDEADDQEGRNLLSFYVSYRAAIRGKVAGFVANDEEVPRDERRSAVRRARAHWLLALSELEEPGRRPCLVLVGGLPGTGKTTVSEVLAEDAGFEVVSSDRVRKGLAGLSAEASGAASFGKGIYTPEWDDRTYEACLEEATQRVRQGKRVIVDASFREEARRRTFLEAARDLGVRSLFFECRTAPDVVRERIEGRRGGASDADWSIYQAAAESWEVSDSELTRMRTRILDSAEGVEDVVKAAKSHLRGIGLVP